MTSNVDAVPFVPHRSRDPAHVFAHLQNNGHYIRSMHQFECGGQPGGARTYDQRFTQLLLSCIHVRNLRN
jgi:hypothetical protein